jgi:hypothetical protein
MLFATYMGLDAGTDDEMRTRCHLIVKSLASRSRKNGKQHHCDARMKSIALYLRGIRLKYAMRPRIPFGGRGCAWRLGKTDQASMRYRAEQTLLKGREVFGEGGQDVTRFDSVLKWVVLADACPLLGKRYEIFYLTIAVPVIFWMTCAEYRNWPASMRIFQGNWATPCSRL